MIRFFASHPTAANLLMIAFIVIGLAAAPNIKRETFPDIPADKVEVRVAYPGASAEEVENAICQRIEDAVDGVNDVDEVKCEALEGSARGVIKMTDGTNLDRFLNDIKTEVEAIDTFPEEVETPIISSLGRTDYVVSLAVSGPMTPSHLKAYAEDLKDRLQQEGNVSQVTIRGFSDHQIRIEIPALTLRQYGLSVSDIADVISRQSIDLPAGAVETSARDVLVRFLDERRSAREFEDLVVVGGGSGAEIRLGDIAKISDGFQDEENKIIFNGQRAAMLEITKTRSEDTLTVVDAVKKFIADEDARAPPTVNFSITRDISSIVRDRLNMLMKNGLQGLVLVFLILWLFFSFRFSFWVAAGLPVSFLGAVFAMWALGYSIDMITMVGLLIAVGLLMDDAIVLSENIATHLSRGKSAIDAAVDGVKQVAPGVIASYITTVCVFGSLIFITGNIGNILKVLPVVLIATLSVSLVEAFLVLPHHLSNSFQHHAEGSPSAFRQGFEKKLAWVREEIVGKLVDKSVQWRYLTLGLVIALFFIAISMMAGGQLKFRAFPKLDGNIIEARILLPQGTPLARTEGVVKRINDALNKVNGELSPRQRHGQSLVTNVNIQYGVNTDAHESGPHVATVSVDLLNAEDRNGSLDDFLNMWRKETGDLSDVISVNFSEFQHGPGGRAIDIRLHGSDLDKLKVASLELQAWLGRYRGVYDLADDLRPGKPETRLSLSEGAVALGLDSAGIANQLRSALFGKKTREIQVGPESLEINIRLAENDRDSLADLEYFTITAKDGQQVPLSAVAELSYGRGYARIARVDGRRTVTVQGQVDTNIANANEIISDTKRRFLKGFTERHPTVSFTFEGQAKEGNTTGASIQRNFMIGLVGVFLLLSYQFRSYIEPIIVIAAIPLGAIGVVFGHMIMGLDLSMPSTMGFASLSGVVVNDAILLVHFIKLRRRAGQATPDAARAASRERFRAVLLTSLTTIVGLLPLMAEQSLQAQILKPLVTSLSFGLATSTVLVLFVIPPLYTIIDDLGLSEKTDDRRIKNIDRGKEAEERRGELSR